MESESDQAESHRDYPRTVLAFEGGPRIDLRRPPSRDERRALASLELGPTFAVLTAEDPIDEGGGWMSAEEVYERQRENARRTLRLEEHLAREGIPFRRADGTAYDGSRRERWVAVAVPRHEAKRLAEAHAQAGLFWYDGERFWPWPAGLEEPPSPPPPP